MTFNRPRVDIFKLILSEYERAIGSLGGSKSTEHDVRDPDEALAEHLVTLYCWKALDFESSDRLLGHFYSAASDELRGHLIEFVGRSFEKQTATLPEDLQTRLMRLWENRINEAKQNTNERKYNKELIGFAWWLHSQKFDPKWLLSQTAEVLRLCKTVDHEFLFTKPLAYLSAEFPVDAANCLFLLVDKLHPDRPFALDREDVRTVLKSAFASHEPKAKQIAAVVRDSLLARGNFGFREISQE